MTIEEIQSEARLNLIKSIAEKRKAKQVQPANFATAMHKLAEKEETFSLPSQEIDESDFVQSSDIGLEEEAFNQEIFG